MHIIPYLVSLLLTAPLIGAVASSAAYTQPLEASEWHQVKLSASSIASEVSLQLPGEEEPMPITLEEGEEEDFRLIEGRSSDYKGWTYAAMVLEGNNQPLPQTAQEMIDYLAQGDQEELDKQLNRYAVVTNSHTSVRYIVEMRSFNYAEIAREEEKGELPRWGCLIGYSVDRIFVTKQNALYWIRSVCSDDRQLPAALEQASKWEPSEEAQKRWEDLLRSLKIEE